jgi:starch synthase
MKVRKSKKTITVLSAVSEVFPFIATGGMGQVSGALAKALVESKRNLDVRIIAPLYASFRDRYEQQMTFLGETTVDLAWRSQYCGLFEMERDGVTYYFVDHRYYFDRDNAYGYYDDGERFAFFSKAVFACLPLAGFTPDVIHAHDWQTALIPIYAKTRFNAMYGGIRTVFTIHDLEYQGKFSMDSLTDVFDLYSEEAGLVEYDGCINLMKGAVIACDKLTTVSPSYAHEIQTGGGFGLDWIISQNSYKLRGIVNGIDVKLYDPATDPALEKNYTVDTLKDKAINKSAVQKYFGLPRASRKMLICVVSRLVGHKGMDLVTCSMDELLKLDVQFLLLGTGEHDYELFFQEKALVHPKKVGVNIAYNPEIAGKIYAGADVILMPSRREPCGLTQMIACRYGTIPIARKTGGLGDTIHDCSLGEGNGFVFEDYTGEALLNTIHKAHELYRFHEQDWSNLMREAMVYDFSWDISAQEYADIFEEIVGR